MLMIIHLSARMDYKMSKIYLHKLKAVSLMYESFGVGVAIKSLVEKL